MHRPGADPADMQIEDFLCDFCHRAWDGAFPMVEGHQGALICGRCLTVAYTQLVIHDDPSSPRDYHCTLCLETRDDPGWQTPVTDIWACTRCVKQAAGRLHKDPDWDWTKPAAPSSLR